MTYAADSQAIKVGVLLARAPEDLGEWLADGTAFDAAGAGALWVDSHPDSVLDPLALTAALAAVTFRSLLVTTLSGSDGSSGTAARTLATIARLSHGRLRILAETALTGEFADIDPGVGVFHRIPRDPGAFEYTFGSADAERWVSAPCPDSRATWRAALLDAAERGCRGLVVPADPRLLDILRNPDDLGDRRDLQLAQG